MHMTVEKTLPLFRHIRPDKRIPAVTEPHAEQMHRDQLAADQNRRLSPVDLPFLASSKL